MIATSLIENNACDQKGLWQPATLAEAHLLLELDPHHCWLQPGDRNLRSGLWLWSSIKKYQALISEHQKLPSALEKMVAEPMAIVFTG